MKKIIFIVFTALLTSLMFFQDAKAGDVLISAPAQAEQGKEATINITALGFFSANHISLFISEPDKSFFLNEFTICNEVNNPSSGLSLKKILPSTGGSYSWTPASPGTYQIIAVVMSSSSNEACQTTNVLGLQSTNISVTASSGSSGRKIEFSGPNSLTLNQTAIIGLWFYNLDGNKYDFYIYDCNNQPHLKKSGVVSGSPDIDDFYQWNPGSSNTEVCAHRVVAKTFDSSGNQTAIAEKTITITPTGGGGGGGGTSGFTMPNPLHIENPVQAKDPLGLLLGVINWLLQLVDGLAVLAIIYSGIMYITSAGNAEQAEKAKKNLTWAIIGLIIVSLILVLPSIVYKAITGEDLP